MNVRINGFVFETYRRGPDGRLGVFVRVPYLGQAYLGHGETSFNSWRALRALGEVR